MIQSVSQPVSQSWAGVMSISENVKSFHHEKVPNAYIILKKALIIYILSFKSFK